ncbi:hypothetical protein NL676_036922 [Syzygium grande]|nr:hypothetical protein NL676_036922 [Syzygium grande]
MRGAGASESARRRYRLNRKRAAVRMGMVQPRNFARVNNVLLVKLQWKVILHLAGGAVPALNSYEVVATVSWGWDKRLCLSHNIVNNNDGPAPENAVLWIDTKSSGHDAVLWRADCKILLAR